MRVRPSNVPLAPFRAAESGCALPVINVTRVRDDMPRSGGPVWVTGWRPETGEPMTVQILADRVPPPLFSPLELPRFEPSPQVEHLAVKLLDWLVRNDEDHKGG